MISSGVLVERVPDMPEGVAVDVIAAATAWLGRAGSWYLGPQQTFTEYLLGNGSDLLILDDAPQPDGESEGTITVEVFESSYRGADDEEEITDFVVRGRRLYRVYSAFWYRWREYRVVYRRGYIVDEGPADFREAVLQMSILLWQDSADDRIGLSSETLGDYSWTDRADAADMAGRLPLVRDVLRVMRRIPVA
jgi:hypothetical protein